MKTAMDIPKVRKRQEKRLKGRKTVGLELPTAQVNLA
jgi:hypothetical protein